MTTNEILNELQDIFRDVLDNESIVINDESTADDIEEWDSLSHIQLVVAVENHFRIKFTSKEILHWSNVGDMISDLNKKLQ